MSLRRTPCFIATLLATALAGAAGSAQATSFDCDSPAAHPDTFLQLNNQLYVSDGHQSRLNLCQTTPLTLGVNVATDRGHAHGATTATADFGLQTVHAALDAKNIVGELGGNAGYQLVARNTDFITASADTSFVVTSRLLYTGSRVVSNPGQDRNSASGNLQIDLGFNQTVSAGPEGSTSLPITTGELHLNAGQTTRIQTYLYADVYVDPNGIYGESPGWALLDARLITTIDIKSGALSASSGHDYSLAAVPEPQTWALMLTGLAAVGGWRRRKAA